MKNKPHSYFQSFNIPLSQDTATDRPDCYLFVFLNQTIPKMATTTADKAANGLIAIGAEKEAIKTAIKMMNAIKPIPVPTTRFLWLIS